MEKKRIFVVVLVLVIAASGLVLWKSTIGKEKVLQVRNIYLYHEDKVIRLTEDNPNYGMLKRESNELLGRKDLVEDTVDQVLTFSGNGTPMSKKSQDYIMEINLKDTIETDYLGNKLKNIDRVLFSLDDNCVYFFEKQTGKERASVAGYRCQCSLKVHFFSGVKECFTVK